MTPEEYLQLLAGFEAQLRRHSDPWGHLDTSPITQDLRKAWESTAAAFHSDYPDTAIPVPFWMHRGEKGAAGGPGEPTR